VGTTVELRDHARLLRRGWLIVLIFTAAGAGAGAALSTRQARMYAASVTMIVSSPDGGAAVADADPASLVSQRVKSYADLVASDRVAAGVIAQLALHESPAALNGQIRARAVPGTGLLNATVTDASPARAQRIANAVGDVFPRAVGLIDAPAGRNARSVRVTVWDHAKLPTSPVSPKPLRSTALGLLAGLVVGIGAAVLRGRRDTPIGTEGEVRDATGLPTLGEIADDAGAARWPLATSGDEGSRRCEQFRQLRTNLRFAAVDERMGSILVTSALPGDGKTTTSCNLAITTARTGARVVLVEADLRSPSFGAYLGLEPKAGLTSVLIGAAALDDVLAPWDDALRPWGDVRRPWGDVRRPCGDVRQPWGEGRLDVLCSGPVPPNPAELLGSRGMSALLADLTARYDLVVLDAPPVLPVADAVGLAGEVAAVLVVARAGRTRRTDIARAVERLAAGDARVLGVVLTMVPARGHDDYGFAHPRNPTRRHRRLRSRWPTGPTPGRIRRGASADGGIGDAAGAGLGEVGFGEVGFDDVGQGGVGQGGVGLDGIGFGGDAGRSVGELARAPVGRTAVDAPVAFPRATLEDDTTLLAVGGLDGDDYSGQPTDPPLSRPGLAQPYRR
jgi:non-specific protein-tyrosine kinase